MKQADNNEDAWRFLKRRAARILPSYMPFIIIWMIVHKFLLRLYFTEICGNLTMMGWWNGDENQLNWYVDCIVVFYILAPYIYKAMTTAKNRMLAVIILIGVALVLGVAFFHGQLIIAVSRLPIFIMGFAFAGITNSLTEGKRAILIWNLLMIIGFAFMYVLMHQQAIDLWHYGLYWYPFILITPGFAIDFGLLYSCLGGNNIGKIIAGLFDKLGAASFEIFLIHLFVYENFMLISTTNWLGWSIMLVGSFVVGYGYHILLNSIMKKISRR